MKGSVFEGGAANRCARAFPPPPLPCLQLRLRRVLPQRPHDGAQLLGRDGAVAVLVEEGERFLREERGGGGR